MPGDAHAGAGFGSAGLAHRWGLASGQNPVDYYFPGYDRNGDDKIDRIKWAGRGVRLLDANHDGGIDRTEFGALYGRLGQGWKHAAPVAAVPVVMDTTLDADLVEARDGKAALHHVQSKCPEVDTVAHEHGLMPTGLTPVFPTGVACPGVDETFALPYEDKTGKGNHGGIDIPTESGTPILAAADGTVVLKVDNQQQMRGMAITLRHSPEDTGLPFWTYTEYAHLQALPSQQVGQRVRMGEIIGLTGNTGVRPTQQNEKSFRRPGIHYAVYYASSRRFSVRDDYVIPEKPRWMDPMALYRGKEPYASQALESLPADEKNVAVPVILLNGQTVPAATRLVWPYACRKATAP
jgi:murein DD-endopeptidase MepM/ murein hydrolase activator NlpD